MPWSVFSAAAANYPSNTIGGVTATASDSIVKSNTAGTAGRPIRVYGVIPTVVAGSVSLRKHDGTTSLLLWSSAAATVGEFVQYGGADGLLVQDGFSVLTSGGTTVILFWDWED
jgi:hypothetical protein